MSCGGRGRAPWRTSRRPWRGRARPSSTSSGSACAAPTSSSSPARWPTCTRGTRATRCGWGTSGAGTVRAVGPGVDPGWVGRRVMGDTMLGCGHLPPLPPRSPARVRAPQRGRHPRRPPGALAEQLAVPVSSLHALPAGIDATVGALVEPGGNALRAARAARARPGDRVLVLGPGAIGSAGRAVPPCGRRRGAPDGPPHGFGGVRAQPGLHARLDPGHPAWPAVRRRGRRLQRRGPAGPGPRPRRAGGPASCTSGWRAAQPDRHPDARAQGRDRGRDPVRLGRHRRGHRGVRRAGASTPGRWSAPPSPSARSARCWPATARRAQAWVPRSTSTRGPVHSPAPGAGPGAAPESVPERAISTASWWRAGDPELRVRPVQVGGDRAGRQVEPVRDLAVGQAAAGQDDDLALLRRQRGQAAAVRGRRGHPAGPQLGLGPAGPRRGTEPPERLQRGGEHGLGVVDAALACGRSRPELAGAASSPRR